MLDDYADDLVHLADRDEAKRVFEHGTRVTRIAGARRVELEDGSPALALLITLGNRRGADPSFLNFETGAARDAEKLDGEVKGASAHCVIKLTEDTDRRGRYRMLLEETRGLGRTPVTRLLATVLKTLSEDRGDQYRNPETNRMNAYRPIVQVHPRQSREMNEALNRGSFLPVELFDTSPVPMFDESPEFQVRRHLLSVKVRPAQGRTFRDAASDLLATAREAGFDRMRISWRASGEKKGGQSEISTDLADIGTAMFAHRELVEVENPLSECAGALNDEFVSALIAEFV